MEIENPIILFDGICNLCNGAVDFVLKRDSKNQFCFIALQSERGEQLIKKYGITPGTDSVILIVQDSVNLESDAAIEIARLLSRPWSWFSVFKIIPKKTRDTIYRWIAKNRYKWFGTRNTCRIL